MKSFTTYLSIGLLVLASACGGGDNTIEANNVWSFYQAKSIKQSFVKMLRKRKNKASIASYMGWAKHANTKKLVKKLLPEYEEF
jgi:hypothetical protein